MSRFLSPGPRGNLKQRHKRHRVAPVSLSLYCKSVESCFLDKSYAPKRKTSVSRKRSEVAMRHYPKLVTRYYKRWETFRIKPWSRSRRSKRIMQPDTFVRSTGSNLVLSSSWREMSWLRNPCSKYVPLSNSPKRLASWGSIATPRLVVALRDAVK